MTMKCLFPFLFLVLLFRNVESFAIEICGQATAFPVSLSTDDKIMANALPEAAALIHERGSRVVDKKERVCPNRREEHGENILCDKIRCD